MSVNLLTEDLVSTFDPRAKLMQLGLVILGSIAVIAAGWGGLTIYGKTVTTQVKNAQDELLRTKADIGNSKADQASMAATAQKLAAMKALVDHHVRWTKFFNKVEQYTLPTVSYGPTIAADIHGGITFAATTHSYDDVALQYLLLQAALLKGDYISAFSINGANRVTSKTGETVTFTINLTFVPTIFDNTLDSLTPTGNPLTNSPSPTESSAGQVLTNTSVPTNTNTTILPTNTNISNTNNPLTP